jgi:flagellar biosynthesis/type III secretory pathway M-ring protein FliF/YscJ
MFTLLTALGSGIWNTLFVTIGYFMGSNWTVIEPYTDIFSKVAYAVILLVVLWFGIRLLLRERKRRALGLPDPDREELEALEEEKAQEEKTEERAEER